MRITRYFATSKADCTINNVVTKRRHKNSSPNVLIRVSVTYRRKWIAKKARERGREAGWLAIKKLLETDCQRSGSRCVLDDAMLSKTYAIVKRQGGLIGVSWFRSMARRDSSRLTVYAKLADARPGCEIES